MATYVANVQHKDERWPVHSRDSLKMAETRASVFVSSLETSSSPTYNSGLMFIGILEGDGKTNSFLFRTFIEYLRIRQAFWSVWCRRRSGTKPLKNKQQCRMVHTQYKRRPRPKVQTHEAATDGRCLLLSKNYRSGTYTQRNENFLKI